MDVGKIEELIKVLEGSRTEEIAVRKGDFTIQIKKGHKPAPVQTAHVKPTGKSSPRADVTPVEPDDELILAPMVGIFHVVDGIARVGANVNKGQVVGTIESMKLLNDVVSNVSGTIKEVLVEEGTPVEYGQPLCRIEPD